MVKSCLELFDLRLNFTVVKRDRVFLVYVLIKNLPINVRAVLKLVMCKARVHRDRRNIFGD